VTKKPLEVRMGSGKGGIRVLGDRGVKPGRILFELDGVPVQVAKGGLELAAASCRSRRALQRIASRRGVMKSR
jgi:large subunit ribosomal protein L16